MRYRFKARCAIGWAAAVALCCALHARPGFAQNAGDAQTTPTASSASAVAPTPAPTPAQSVFVIPVQDEIEDGLYLVLNRALNTAERSEPRPKAVILDMHTPGGSVSSAIKIRDRLVKCPIKTYTFVNNMAISAGAFIALATDTIVMGNASNIGGALPITISPGEGVKAADEKFISIFASEMRKTAKHKGHPEDIAEAFCNPDKVIPGIKEKGKILTLDYDQATSVGLAAFSAPSIEGLLEHEKLAGASIVRFRPTLTDGFARFLSNPVVAGLLMMIGLGGIFLEIKTPGLGLPGAVGVGALALYFFGAYLANLSGYMEIIFFILGVILLVVEIYVIPGFGVVGAAGIALMAGSLFFALFNLAPSGFDFQWGQLQTPLLTMVAALLGLAPALWGAARLLPHTPLYGHLNLEPPKPRADSGEGSAPAASGPIEIGAAGTALTDLRPGGTGHFGGRRVDVYAEGEFIPRGAKIRVVRVEGYSVMVHRAPD